MPIYMTAMGGVEVFNKNIIVKSSSQCEHPPYLSPWTTCVYCGRVTLLTYEAVVVEERSSKGEPVDKTIYAQSDHGHNADCPYIASSGGFIPLALRRFEASSDPRQPQVDG